MSKLDINFVNRYNKQSYNGSTSATKVRATNREFIYSRYKYSKKFKDGYERLLTCAFTHDDQCLLIGTEYGRVLILNKYNDTLIAQKSVHHNCDVTSLAPHKSGELLLTSCGPRTRVVPKSALWNINHNFQNQFMLNYCEHAEFNHAQDKVLGTSRAIAKLYDLNCGEVIHEFKPEISNLYEVNKAVLNPSDELLLTDGVMFDVRSGKQVHKFEKMNDYVNGVFHTNRLELISSSEIWDLRMFHLLQTVESLESCNIIFNNYGDVIFSQHKSGDYVFGKRSFIFEVIDATDYSSIAKINMDGIVRSLAVSNTDTQIAVAMFEVHLYDVGMVQHEEEINRNKHTEITDRRRPHPQILTYGRMH